MRCPLDTSLAICVLRGLVDGAASREAACRAGEAAAVGTVGVGGGWGRSRFETPGRVHPERRVRAVTSGVARRDLRWLRQRETRSSERVSLSSGWCEDRRPHQSFTELSVPLLGALPHMYGLCEMLRPKRRSGNECIAPRWCSWRRRTRSSSGLRPRERPQERLR